MKRLYYFIMVIVVGALGAFFSPSAYADDTVAIADAVADSVATSDADATNTTNEARQYSEPIQITFPGLIPVPGLTAAGPNVRQIETILPFLSELTAEQAESLAETPNWFGDGVSVLENFLSDEKVSLENRAQIVTIHAAKAGDSVIGSNLGFLIGSADKNEVETIDLIGAMVFSAWENGGNTLVLTAEGYRRVADALGISLGLGYVKATETSASSGGTGISWAQAGNEDYPFLQGVVLRK
ncbi:MAG: hypothetical protein ABIE14_05515 [Patescibacteria group bacterium]